LVAHRDCEVVILAACATAHEQILRIVSNDGFMDSDDQNSTWIDAAKALAAKHLDDWLQFMNGFD
jgi:hypothetical protein